MTYVSVTCLWGEKGMCKGGYLQNSVLWRERWNVLPLHKPPTFLQDFLYQPWFFSEYYSLLPFSLSYKEYELLNSILANQESSNYFLFSLMWFLLFLLHKLSCVFSISLSLLLPMKAEVDVKEMKLIPPTDPQFATSFPELHSRNSWRGNLLNKFGFKHHDESKL